MMGWDGTGGGELGLLGRFFEFFAETDTGLIICGAPSACGYYIKKRKKKPSKTKTDFVFSSQH